MKLIKATGGDIIKAPAQGSRAQNLFNQKTSLYAKKGVITSESYLRLEYNTTGTLSNIPFTVLDSQSGRNATERRLKINDTFTVMAISFYLGIAPGGYATALEQSKSVLHTFPNKYVVSAAEAINLQAIYNGYLSLVIDSTTFLDSVPMYKFYRVGTSQESVGSTATNNHDIARSQFDAEMYGIADQVPSIELNGGANISLQATLPTAVDLTIATNGLICTLIMTGFLHSGAKDVQREVAKELRAASMAPSGRTPRRGRSIVRSR